MIFSDIFNIPKDLLFMEKQNTAEYKSKKFAVRIVNLYKYLCSEKKNLFCQNKFSDAVQVLALILQNQEQQ